MKVEEYYTIWINQQSKEFINSKIWTLEKVVEFAEDYKNRKFLNKEVLAEVEKCPICKSEDVQWVKHCCTCDKNY